MTRRHGVMAPPPQDGPPQRGLMAPATTGPALDHAVAIPKLLWLVAGVLAAIELALVSAPNG